MAKDPASEIMDPRVGEGVATDGMAATLPGTDRGFFGHPRGLATLFFTEMWERFSYYGMRALLVLFMVDAAAGANPGLGFTDGRATAIYGLYTFFVYVLALPGGWIADNLWGQRKAVFVGGCIIAAGHFSMAIPSNTAFFVGLLLIVIGTGLLKPNVSTMVGDLYPEGGARRDAGFSIFYMGINLGAFLGPILCGLLGENYNWHWGFSLAGIGMVLGLIQYQLGGRYLGTAGRLQVEATSQALAQRARMTYAIGAVFVGIVLVVGFLVSGDALPISIEALAGSLGVVAVVVTLAFFVYIIFFGGHTMRERKQLGVILWLFVLAALFWSGFEQAGSSLNLFAERLTERTLGPAPWAAGLGAFIPVAVFGIAYGVLVRALARNPETDRVWIWLLGAVGVALAVFVYWLTGQVAGQWEAPASWLQSINSIFIILLAPLFGLLWTSLAHRQANPSIPLKFAFGLVGLAAGFFVLAWGAANASAENPVSPAWLVVTYFFHTVGELCLSPVGLSSMTKLAPKSRVGQMMGVWFVAAALGNLFAGLVAGQLETLAPTDLFQTVALITGGGGLVALILSPFVRRLMGNVE